MELIIGIIIGILIGALAGIFVFGKSAFEKLNQAKIQEVNRQAELALSEAKKIAERTTNEARQKANQAKEEARRSTEEARRSTEDARRAVEEAERQSENAKKQKMLEAKEHFIQKKADFENEVGQRRQQLKEEELAFKQVEANVKQQQKIVTDKELAIEAKEAELGVVRENLNRQLEIVTQKKQALEKAHEEHISALEEVARLTQEQAKEQLLKIVRDKAESDALNIIRDSTEQAKLTAGKEAKKIVIQTIQRMAAEHTIENSVSVFNLDSDDLKGQIIGREGRNIRALEAATGAEIVVDDTPEAIVISSFDPIRREVARLALQRLVADGRIHPARIEEVVAKTRKQVDEQIMEIGERTVLELNIHALNPALVRMVGRMRFRSSYGQNLLKHSIETANLCAIMAAELGFTAKQIKMAKRAGLLHDIGKVAEEETELSHAILGMKLCEKHGEHAAISNAVGAHHDEIEMNNIISPIVQACDAISGARPGARREILESYLERIRELEKVATSYEGVQKAYAIQAGRELRVIVEAEKVPDEEAQNLSFQIANRIQNEMQYPGQIKVTVIREMRATTFAR